MRLDQLLDGARDARGLKSDAALGRALGITQQTVNNYRTGRAWPSDDVMIKLADMAGVDQNAALLDLNIWRSKSPEVASAYIAMRDKLTRAASLMLAPLLIAGSVCYSTPSLAEGGASPATQCILWRLVRQWFQATRLPRLAYVYQ